MTSPIAFLRHMSSLINTSGVLIQVVFVYLTLALPHFYPCTVKPLLVAASIRCIIYTYKAWPSVADAYKPPKARRRSNQKNIFRRLLDWSARSVVKVVLLSLIRGYIWDDSSMTGMSNANVTAMQVWKPQPRDVALWYPETYYLPSPKYDFPIPPTSSDVVDPLQQGSRVISFLLTRVMRFWCGTHLWDFRQHPYCAKFASRASSMNSNSTVPPSVTASAIVASSDKIDETQQEMGVVQSFVSFLSKIGCGLRRWNPQQNQSSSMPDLELSFVPLPTSTIAISTTSSSLASSSTISMMPASLESVDETWQQSMWTPSIASTSTLLSSVTTSTMSTSSTKVNGIQQQSEVLSLLVVYLSKISYALRHWYPQHNQSNSMSSPQRNQSSSMSPPQQNQSSSMSSPQQNPSSSMLFPITKYMPSPTSDTPTPMKGMISPSSIVSPTPTTGMVSLPPYATPTPMTSPDVVDDVGLDSAWWIEMRIAVAKFVWPDISHVPTPTPVSQRSDVLFVVLLVFQFVTWWLRSAKHKSSVAALQREINDLKRQLSIDHHAPIPEPFDEDESEDDATASDEAPLAEPVTGDKASIVEPVTDHYAPIVEPASEAGSKDDAAIPDALLEQENAPQEATTKFVGQQQHQGDNTVSDEPAQDVDTGGDNHISDVEVKLVGHSDDENEESKNKMSTHPVTSENVFNLLDSPKEDLPIDIGSETAPTPDTAPTPETAAKENPQLQAAMMASTQTTQEDAPDSDGWQEVTYKKPVKHKQRGQSNKCGSFHNWQGLPSGNWRESTSGNQSPGNDSGTRLRRAPPRQTSTRRV